MKTSAEKSSSTASKSATQVANQLFFTKAGGGGFFAPSVQMKMTVNKPGDKFEQEADKMADKVMRMPAPAPTPGKDEKLQRVPEEKLQKKEEEKIQKAALPEEKVQKQADEKLQKAAAPEEKIQKAEDDKLQKAEMPEEKVQKQADEKLQKADAPEEKVQKAEDEKLQKATAPEEKIQKQADEKLQKAAAQEEKLQRKGNHGTPAVSSDAQSSIRNKTTGGQPLSADVRSFMEPRFNADFSTIRVHTDQESASLNNQLSARAFTYQNHVFFSRDQYQPGSSEGKQLLAHELTHTIQQGHAVQRSAQISTTTSTPPVQRLGIQDALDKFAEWAYNIPGFRLLTIVLGFNPVNMRTTDRNAANLLRALIEVIPGGAFITQALDNHGVITKAAAWVEQKIETLGDIGSDITGALKRFLDSLSWTDIFDLGGVWERAKRIFTAPISRLISFGASVALEILKMVKDAILKPLAAMAQGTRGYDLLKALLGEDPISGEPYPPTAENLLGGFMKLIGQEEIWQNIQKGNAIARAWAWFQGALTGLMARVRAIPQQIVATLTSLTFQDIITVAGAFGKIVSTFVNIAGDFISWGLTTIWNLLEIIFDVVKPGLMGYIKKTGAALKGILQNPLPFLGNLVNAAKLGFQNFAARFGTHLKAGLIDWLTGSLKGVYIPKALTLPELGKFALSVLGITWAQIRGKIVKALGPNGEKIMQGLETAFDVIVAFVKGGVAAVWDFIKEKLADLRDTVIGGIVSFITDSIIKKAVPKLVAMFIPGAGFISAIISIYDTVMVFVQKLSKIAQVVGAFIDSIVTIAAGNISAAAKRVETVLAGLLSLAISFMAGFVGLGKVSDKVMEVIQKVRVSVDKAIDAAIAWIVAKAKALFGKLFGKKDKKDTPVNKTTPVSMAGASHTLKIKEQGGNLKVSLASREESIRDKFGQVDRILKRWEDYINSIGNPAIKEEFALLLKPYIEAKKTSALTGSVAKLEGMKSAQFEELKGEIDNTSQALAGEISAWANNAGVPVKDFSDNAVKAELARKAEEAANKVWLERKNETQQKLEQYAGEIQALDPAAKLKYRGSLAKQRKGVSKDFGEFNPWDFDIDFFVESDKLYLEAVGGRVPEAAGKQEIWADRHPGLKAKMDAMAAAYDAITGVRKGKFSLKLRSASNVRDLLAAKGTRESAGERHVEITPPPPAPSS